MRERGLQRRGGYSQKISNEGEDIAISYDCSILASMAIDRELEVSEVKGGRDELAGLSN